MPTQTIVQCWRGSTDMTCWRGHADVTRGIPKDDVGDNQAIRTIYMAKYVTVDLTSSAWEAFFWHRWFSLDMFLATAPFLPFRRCRQCIGNRRLLLFMLAVCLSDFADADDTSAIFKELFHRPESSIGARLFFIKQILSCVHLVFMPCLLREKWQSVNKLQTKQNVINDKTQQQKNPFIPTKLTLFRNEKVVPKRKNSQSFYGVLSAQQAGVMLEGDT